MMIIRPIRSEDTETFVKIAFDAGIGLTSLPKNREKLVERIHKSEASFRKNVMHPADEFYLFVLEDLQTGKIGGTCGITAQTARQSPLFFYRVERKEKHEDAAHAIRKIPTMRAVQYRNYWSEICSLYLCDDFRHHGIGRLLSLSRFLFIANDPKRFTKMLFAEMRGHIADHGCVFWEGIGKHFVEAEFETLMQMRDDGQIDLTQALPAHPIYLELLPKEVQDSIGTVHENTMPALKMLLQEGFQLSHEIDVCDGGPKVEVEVCEIRSIKKSSVKPVAEIVKQPISSPQHILAKQSTDFRACLGTIDANKNGGVVITAECAAALQLKVGDTIRYVIATEEKKS